MATRSEVEPAILQLWRARPDGSRTELNVQLFCGELQRDHPELLDFVAAGDKYQVLKSILRNEIER